MKGTHYDAYIKNDGDFVTLCLMTSKAIETLNTQSENVRRRFVGNDRVKKLSVDSSFKKKLIAYCVSHNLVLQEF